MNWINNIRNQLNRTQTQKKKTQVTKLITDRTAITGEKILKDNTSEQEYLLKNNDKEIYKNDVLKVKITEKTKKIEQKEYKVVELIEVTEQKHHKKDVLKDITNLLDIDKEKLVISGSTGNPLTFTEEGLKQLYNRITTLMNTIYLKEKAEAEQ